MKLNREATLANLIEKQRLLFSVTESLSKEDVEIYHQLQVCIDAIKAGYPDSQVLEALQFVGPGIAVQS